MKPTAARQRREAHRTRLALPRALHTANQARRSYGALCEKAWKSGVRRAPQISISRGPLRKHHQLLLWTLLRA